MKKKENKDRVFARFRLSLSSLLKSNKFILLVSFVAAVTIWITVSPNREVTFGMTANIDTKNTTAESLGLEVIDGLEQHIDITVSGKWYVISELTDKDIRLTYSLSDVTKAGEYEIALSAVKATQNSDYEIVRISPERVKVSFDYIYTRSFEIQVSAPNIKAKEGLILETPVADGSSIIQISGPRSVVERIDHVSATVDDRATLDSSASYTVPLKIFNKNGKEESLDGLTVPFTEVNVTVPVSKSKQVPLKIDFANAPAYYQSNPLNYTLSVSSLNVIGSPEIIDSLEVISVGTVDFSNLSPTSNTFAFDLKLPSGVRMIDDIKSVTATVDVSAIAQKTVEITSIRVVNSPAGTSTTPVTVRRSVAVAGPRAVISAVSGADLYLECDMSGYTASGVVKGEFVADAALKSDKYNNIWSVGSSRHEVQLKSD